MESTGFRKTHPLILGAAASVMVVSLVGAAAIGGLLPEAHSDKADGAAQSSAPAAEVRHGVPGPAARDSVCASCGTVASIRMVEIKGDATGLGAVAGGVTGAVVGNRMGRGNGNAIMTLLGAAGGAMAGNEIERNVKKRYRYHVTVRMDDGSFRTVSQASVPSVRVGEHVRVINGAVLTRS
ncbi:hypothetical protein GALL_140240 [mine drainage metagenome]|uniref:Glycine zipper 2TM domain-containing protein n=1 Tax=mine drainage metagenome TaxID=410659 RepID=A0A1J5S7C5_9ZZZZ